ncbi:hypothetical protein D915_004881 [Fasciola hepatica]|uniref:C3H1-type domain-containing protein n=1 Tax=Fasciola hepatica TaxID=6192 RepID=A0A4E0RAL7_FASHE|nr:hypothetical protein D915_004881 [Fasciola hepatica]
MLSNAMEHVAYNPEDCLPLLSCAAELMDLPTLDNGDVESLDDYPLPPILETLFGPVSLTYSSGGTINPLINEKPIDLVDECCGLANLDEVPMELNTSDEDGPDSSDESHIMESQRNNYSAELDEMELRSRALRSLLLKKRSPRSPLEFHEELVSAQTLPRVQSSKQLAIGSGRLKTATQSQEKFVITVCDTSSESDAGEDLEPTRVKTNENSVSSTCQDVTSKPTKQKCAPRSREIELFERQMLHQKMILLRQRLTVKRQQRIVDERRQLVRKLTVTLGELRKRLRSVSSLYKEASKSLLLAQRLHSAYQKKLTTTQKSYSALCEKLSHAEGPNSKVDPSSFSPKSVQNDAHVPNKHSFVQHKALVLSSLDTLQRARTTTAYFNYYRFESPSANAGRIEVSTNALRTNALKSQDQKSSDISASKTQSFSRNRMNPAVPLCPYLLDGECKDSNCLLQHPPCLLSANRNVYNHRERFSSSITPIDPDSRSAVQIRPGVSPESEFYCEFCKEPLLSSNEVHSSEGLRKWHSAYLTFKRSTAKNSALKTFLHESQLIVREHSDSATVGEHHLAIICLENPTSCSAEILECLKLSNFPIIACRCVLRNSYLTVRMRLAVAQSTIEYLGSQLKKLSLHAISPLGASFVYIVYHYCRLLLETENNTRLTNFLDEQLSTLPKENPCRLGVWWIRLSLALNETLPPESAFFSSANLPSLPRIETVEKLELVREALADLGIPDKAFDLLCALSASEDPLLYSLFAMLYIYVHSLLVTQQYGDAARFCWSVATSPAVEAVDDLFFPLAVYASFHADSSLDWTTVLNQYPQLVTSDKYVAYRIEFGFLFANLAWRRGMSLTAREALLESLASVILLPSDHDSDVLCGFQRLMLLSDLGDSVPSREVHSVDGSRGKTYLWLSYCLFCLICPNQLEETTIQLIRHCKSFLKGSNPTAYNISFHRLLLHMAIVLINKLYVSNVPLYYKFITGVLCDPVLPFDRLLLPTWFTELVQRTQLALLPSPGERHDLCVTLVETYGPLLVPSLCRGLFALGDHFLARGLCSIARLDKPDSEAFWLLFGSLTVNESTNSALSERNHYLSSLIEVFTEATATVPSSTSLWRQYIQIMITSGLDAGALQKRAEELGVRVAFEELGPEKQKTSTVNHKLIKTKDGTVNNQKSLAGKSIPLVTFSQKRISSTNSVTASHLLKKLGR